MSCVYSKQFALAPLGSQILVNQNVYPQMIQALTACTTVGAFQQLLNQNLNRQQVVQPQQNFNQNQFVADIIAALGFPSSTTKKKLTRSTGIWTIVFDVDNCELSLSDGKVTKVIKGASGIATTVDWFMQKFKLEQAYDKLRTLK